MRVLKERGDKSKYEWSEVENAEDEADMNGAQLAS